MSRVLINKVGGISACRAALNASGNLSFFRRYQLVVALMAEYEPRLFNDWAGLKMIPVSIKLSQAPIHKCSQTHSREAKTREKEEGHKKIENSKTDLD